MPGGREPGHVHTDLGDDDRGRRRPDPGDLVQPSGRVTERGQMPLDLFIDRGDVPVDLIDPTEHGREQEPVVRIEVTGERFLQLRDLLPHPGPCHLCEHPRVLLPTDQRGHHLSPGDAEDIAGDDGQFDARVFEELLHPVLLRAPRTNQIDPVPGQVPEPADRARRNEAGSEHLSFRDLAQPHRVQHIGLRSPRKVSDVFRVHQPHLEPVRFEEIERRPPVVAGRFHHDPLNTEFDQPVRELGQRAGHRRMRAHLLHPAFPAARRGQSNAAHHLRLANIQRRDPLEDLLLILSLREHPRLPSLCNQHLRVTAGETTGKTTNLVLVLRTPTTPGNNEKHNTRSPRPAKQRPQGP
jgi:hypothetical protein